MSLSKAVWFVNNASDRSLRQKCYLSTSRVELLQALGFTEYEFEDAINMKLVKCQTYEEADRVQQLKMWFSIL
jgi:hypothetical protein